MNWKPISEKPKEEDYYLVWLGESWARVWFCPKYGWDYLPYDEPTHWCEVEGPEDSLTKRMARAGFDTKYKGIPKDE